MRNLEVKYLSLMKVTKCLLQHNFPPERKAALKPKGYMVILQFYGEKQPHNFFLPPAQANLLFSLCPSSAFLQH